MKAYKCDICKELYENREQPKINQNLVFFAYSRTHTVYDDEADICPKCVLAIQKIIDERGKGNGTT